MGIYDDLSKLDSKSPTPKDPGVRKQSNKRKVSKETNQSIDQSTDRSIGRPTGRLTDQLTQSLNDIDNLGPVVEKPRAFYITQKVDRWLDEAVRHLRDKGMHKVDRSIMINALIHDEELYKPSILKLFRKRLLAHLTNKSLKRT